MMNNCLCTAALLLVAASAASAEIIRCEVTDRSHRLMPEWIEYELRERGTVLEVRDSVGAEIGADWVRGAVSENTPNRMTLRWDNGVMPQQNDWWRPGRIAMVLTRIPNGEILVVGIPDNPIEHRQRYNGRAVCGS
ncbi:MAG: hypothetical protein ACRCS3_06730 [Paracoccaceae bacterium]